MNLKILVCCHKDDVKAVNKNYLPIHVGKSTSKQNLNMIVDDTGDNISYKNSSYCELTGIYWAWKNLKDVDYVGLAHYRRYFDFKNEKLSGSGRTLPIESFDKIDFNIPDDVKKILKKGKVIISKPESFRLSLYADYCIRHYSEDIKKLEKIINNLEEKKYSKAFNKIMHHNNELHPYNMFIMSWQEFDKYCTWLFYVLNETEKLIDISNYTPYQKRIYGFMAERLLNIYLEANNIRVKEYPILFFSDEKPKNNNFFIYKIKSIINKFSSRYASPNIESFKLN